MKREVRALLASGVDSLVLSVDRFNSSDDRGRATATLILLHHSFEMLLKASILHRGGSIREKGETNTIGFKTCVQRALSDGGVKFLSEDNAVLLRSIYGLRSAAEHHLLTVTEPHLYWHVQGGLTLFRDLHRSVFARDLTKVLPPRVLPVATLAPLDIEALFASETAEVMKLLAPGRRQRASVLARLHPLAIFDGAASGLDETPTRLDLLRLAKRLRDGERWDDVFSGAATIQLTTADSSHRVQLRFSKKEGIPIATVPDGTVGVSTVGVKRVNELDYYNLSFGELKTKCGVTQQKLTALVWHLGLRNDETYAKTFWMGKSLFTRYSQQALSKVREAIRHEDCDAVWAAYKASRDRRGRSVDSDQNSAGG